MNFDCEDVSHDRIMAKDASMSCEYDERGRAVAISEASWGSRVEMRIGEDSNRIEMALESGESGCDGLSRISVIVGKSDICAGV